MKREKLTGWTVSSAILIVCLFIPAEKAVAQWAIGASYELREHDPASGFGLRIEHNFLGGMPVVNIGLRAHFSYFNETVGSYRNPAFPAELESYDYGLALLGGVKVGLLRPYVGAGLGRENFEAVYQRTDQLGVEDYSLYWNLFIGAELLPLPVIKPFIEYRFIRLFNDDFFDYKHNGRLAVGVKLLF